MVIHAIIEPYTEQRGHASFRLKAVPDFIPAKPPLVRMLAEDMVIRWTPIEKDKTRLEDLYLPYKQKRRTKAQIAKEAGLEPLAMELWQNPDHPHSASMLLIPMY